MVFFVDSDEFTVFFVNCLSVHKVFEVKQSENPDAVRSMLGVLASEG